MQRLWSFLERPAPVRASFDDVLLAIQHPHMCLINTLPANEQGCLIAGTLPHDQEEEVMNGLVDAGDTRTHFVVYGRNSTDTTVVTKAEQLLELGFAPERVLVYAGGMFEWVLLQDVYGTETFVTTTKVKDLLVFSRPTRTAHPSKLYLTFHGNGP